MNFCTSGVDVHKILTTTSSTTLIFLGTKKKLHNIHHILQATNSDDTQYKVLHVTSIVENVYVVQWSSTTNFEKRWNLTLVTMASKMS